MNKKLLLLLGLCLGWGEILIGQLDRPVNAGLLLMIFIPISGLFIILMYRQEINEERLPLVESLAIGIAAMTILHFLRDMLPEVVQYIVLSIVIIGLLYMSLMVFVSLKHAHDRMLDIQSGTQASSIILFVNTSTVLLYLMLSRIERVSLDSIIVLIIICAYIWYAYHHRKESKVRIVVSKKAPVKAIILVCLIMFFISIAYGPFVNGLKNQMTELYLRGYIYIRVAYLIGLVLAYHLMKHFKNHVEVILMGTLAMIVLAMVVKDYFVLDEVVLISTIIIQVAYGCLHSIIGGLFVMIGYLYGKTYKFLLGVLGIAGVSLMMGLLMSNLLWNNTVYMTLTALLFNVLAMISTMFVRKDILEYLTQELDEISYLMNRSKGLEDLPEFETLTTREKEVVKYLMTDLKLKQVAGVLEISENTLKKHSRSIYHKLDVKNKKELQEVYR